MHIKRTLMRWFPALCLAGIIIQSAAAQSTQPTPTEPNAQGDASALGARLDALLPPLLTEHQIPGAAVAVISSGETVWSQGYGVADTSTGIPVTADTPFSAWSISKTLTAAAIMGLVDQGRIDLDAPISTYLTRWHLPTTRQPVDQVTARRILTHTAGLSVDGYQGYTVSDTIPTLIDLLDGHGGAARVGVIQRPGERFLYSGGGYAVLQEVIEELTSQPFADYMQQTILQPLGMTHSSFTYDPALGIATNYAGAMPDPHVIQVAQSAGGLVTSANDLAVFLAALMDGRVIPPERVTEMFAADPVAAFYGFGVYSDHAGDGSQIIFHDGISPSARSLYVLFPERREGIVILTNSGGGQQIDADVLCAFNAFAITDAPELCVWHG